MTTIHISCTSPKDTQKIAAQLGRALTGGEVLALRGDLGAGKTCFVQGLAQGLDVPPEVYVRSPTFALIDEYPGRIPLFHLDLYRLDDEDELEAIGWRDCLDGTAIVAIEWAERIQEALPHDHIDVQLSIVEDPESQREGNLRTLSFSFPPSLQHLADAIATLS